MSGIKGKSGVYTRTKKMKVNMSKAQMGHLTSDITKKKMSKGIKENLPRTVFKKGQIPYNKNKECPEISERQKGRNNPNWRGGATPKNKKIRQGIEMNLWRESVFARDNWTCQKCGERGGKLRSHHIRNFAQFPELRTSIENGITFCDKCHREFHRKYGRKNNTKEQINDYLKL